MGAAMNLDKYQGLLSTDISDALGQSCAMDIGIQCQIAQGKDVPRLFGLAYTVRCENRSNTYLHDAIYSAAPGSVVVVEAEAQNYACLLYTSPSPRDKRQSRMPSSA